jgi:hypothetical protein
MRTQAELIFNRAVELEKRAAQNEGSLRDTLLMLAGYYRRLAERASEQIKRHQQTIQMKSEAPRAQ